MKAQHQPNGSHCLADLFGIRPVVLSDPVRLEQLLRGAAEAAGASVLFARFHTFGPDLGVTGVVLLAESHISIHTWPESGFAAADIFMCGGADPQLALAVLLDRLAPTSHLVHHIERGTPHRDASAQRDSHQTHQAGVATNPS